MTTYSEDAFKKLNKDDLIGIALNLKVKWKLPMPKFWRN